MKKKLLLIPTIVLSCGAAGCVFDSPIVTIKEWFGNNAYQYRKPCFAVKYQNQEGISSIDFEESVKKMIYNSLAGVQEIGKNVKESKKDKTETYLSYTFSCDMRNMDYCEVRIYDNGYINTKAYLESGNFFAYFMRPRDQDVSYRISEETAKEIIQYGSDRYADIKEVQDRENAELKEYAKFENVFKRAEETTKELRLWSSTPNEIIFPSIITDTNREFLDCLKQIDYSEESSEWYYTRYRSNSVSYELKDDFTIVIATDYEEPDKEIHDALVLHIRKDQTYPTQDDHYFYYEIDPKDGKQLVDKANEMISDYAKTLK